ncbi:unnamed protein product [Meganyctiphanes norvegica]|uniref:limulus clotting factor C n=1 Tax=Meganyctiphanes norvegica TaxID=48144 RepID=A0AAV2QDN4_MEGNR
MESLEVEYVPTPPDNSRFRGVKKFLKKCGCFCLGMTFSMTLFGLTLYNFIRLFIPEEPYVRRGCQCGHRYESVQDEVFGEWPWQVAMRINMTDVDHAVEDEVEKFCAASLIHEEWLLTAADCVPYIGGVPKPEAIVVSVGEVNKDMWNYTVSAEERSVDLIIVHKDYERERHLDDIAVMHLSTPVNDTKYIMPVCLPLKHMDLNFEGETVTVTGWGTLSFNQRVSETVIAVDLPVLNNDKCDIYHKDYPVWEDMLCTYERGRDSCQGDSGGPLVWLNEKGRYQLIGVTSFGTICGKAGSPGVYTRVTTYIDWIQQSTNVTFCMPKK